jgi:hypothetical protein
VESATEATEATTATMAAGSTAEAMVEEATAVVGAATVEEAAATSHIPELAPASFSSSSASRFNQLLLWRFRPALPVLHVD